MIFQSIQCTSREVKRLCNCAVTSQLDLSRPNHITLIEAHVVANWSTLIHASIEIAEGLTLVLARIP